MAEGPSGLCRHTWDTKCRTCGTDLKHWPELGLSLQAARSSIEQKSKAGISVQGEPKETDAERADRHERELAEIDKALAAHGVYPDHFEHTGQNGAVRHDRLTRAGVIALNLQPSTPSAIVPKTDPHPDTLALVRLIELLKAMDIQAERITKREQMTWRDGADQEPRDEDFEEVIIGYKFNTGCWHRILGTIAGHEASKWLQTPEGQARVREAVAAAQQTMEELRKAQQIDPKILNERFSRADDGEEKA